MIKILLLILFLFVGHHIKVNSAQWFMQDLSDTLETVSLGRDFFKFEGPINCKTGLLSLGTHSNYLSTDFIDVSGFSFVEYTLPVSIIAGITFYDSKKNLIDGFCSTKKSGIFMSIPLNVSYARFSQRTDTNRDYTILLHKRDNRPKYNQLNLNYRQVFSHEEFGKDAIARIPIHIRTNTGSLIVACEAKIRKNNKTESFVYLARSEDEGNSWQKQLLYKGGNPNLVYDKVNNRVFALNGFNYYVSDDDGKSWSKEKPLRIKVPHGWEYCYQAPTTGIQIQNGIMATVYEAFRGHRNMITSNSNFLVYSRDYGNTWETTPTTPESIIANEATLVEFEPDQIMINARGGTEVFWNSPNPGRRIFVPIKKMDNRKEKWNIDSWITHSSDCKLIEPLCSASFISVVYEGRRYGLFCNPYTNKFPRKNLMLQISDDYTTWYPIGLLTKQDEEVLGYCSLYFNINRLSFVYEDIDKGIMFSDMSDYMEILMKEYRRKKYIP